MTSAAINKSALAPGRNAVLAACLVIVSMNALHPEAWVQHSLPHHPMRPATAMARRPTRGSAAGPLFMFDWVNDIFGDKTKLAEEEAAAAAKAEAEAMKKAKEEAAAAKAESEARQKVEAEARAKQAEEEAAMVAKAKAEAEARFAEFEAQQKSKADAEEAARDKAEAENAAKAKADAEEAAKAEADAKAAAAAEEANAAEAREVADEAAKAAAEEAAKAEAEAKAKADADAKAAAEKQAEEAAAKAESEAVAAAVAAKVIAEAEALKKAEDEAAATEAQAEPEAEDSGRSVSAYVDEVIENQSRVKGVVQWYNGRTGFGFIQPYRTDEEGKELVKGLKRDRREKEKANKTTEHATGVFVHHSVIQVPDDTFFRKLYQGETVDLEIALDNRNRPVAKNVTGPGGIDVKAILKQKLDRTKQ